LKKKKKTGWIIALIIVAALVGFGVMNARKMASTVSEMISSYTVERGNVSVTISGSGKLAAAGTAEVEIPSGVAVSEIFAETGDTVSEGDVLAALDADSLQDRLSELSSELSSLDQKLANRSTTNTIKTMVGGRIKVITAGENEAVADAMRESGYLALLSTDGYMKLTITSDVELALNDKVTVVWGDEEAEGTVSGATADGYVILLSDQKAPYLGTAQVLGEDDEILGEGTLEINAPYTVMGTEGVIKSVSYSVGDKASASSTLFKLSSEVETVSYQQTKAEREETAAELLKVMNYLNDPNVYAPVDGSVQEVKVSEGEAAASTAQGSTTADDVTAFVLSSGGAVKMEITVDELDILSIAVGQSAKVTLDAFSNRTFEATVTHISHVGESSGSITVYPVEIELASGEGLLEGMSGTVAITSASVENVLLVPLTAINEDASGSYVNLLSDTDEVMVVYIETGLSDGTYAEVTSGLSEGDRVQDNPKTTSDFSAMFQQGNGSSNGGN